MLRTTDAAMTKRISQNRTLLLPNGYEVAYQSKAELEYFYRDIFEHRVYLRHGIMLRDGDCVVDVGANIGLFTLFVHTLGYELTSLSFEPAPRIFELLRVNLSRYAPRARLFNCGIAAEERFGRFTFYPNSPGMSSFHAGLEEEKETLRAIMQNQRAQGMPGMDAILRYADDLLDERFRSETLSCPLRPLSKVLREERVERVDLLKVDVQKSELEVLLGIDRDDWRRIHQIVLEVHDLDGALDRVRSLLDEHGFAVVVEQEALYVGSKLYNVYGRRSASEIGRAHV